MNKVMCLKSCNEICWHTTEHGHLRILHEKTSSNLWKENALYGFTQSVDLLLSLLIWSLKRDNGSVVTFCWPCGMLQRVHWFLNFKPCHLNHEFWNNVYGQVSSSSLRHSNLIPIDLYTHWWEFWAVWKTAEFLSKNS